MRANISGKLPHVFRFRLSKIMPEDCEMEKKFLKNPQILKNGGCFASIQIAWSAAVCMIITNKMAVEATSSTKQHKNILIGVTGSVASIKLTKLVDELLLLQPKVRYIFFRNS